MGQKVNPRGLRIGIGGTWDSKWFSRDKYRQLLQEDLKIRELVKENFMHAGISRIGIERKVLHQRLTINICTARPGIVIGRKGQEVERLKKALQALTGKQIYINIQEINQPALNAQMVAENIAMQLERRIAFRRAMKQAMQDTMRAGALGVKVMCAGRLAGAEIARTEWYRQGRMPLHTLRANIDYGFCEANTTAGKIGVKAWIFNKEEISDAHDASPGKIP